MSRAGTQGTKTAYRHTEFCEYPVGRLRDGSSRLPGKPSVDICGKPMIWWVYQVITAKRLSGVYVATDDERIVAICT
jgi:hypothetical protein